jgi:hypothetical protein
MRSNSSGRWWRDPYFVLQSKPSSAEMAASTRFPQVIRTDPFIYGKKLTIDD